MITLGKGLRLVIVCLNSDGLLALYNIVISDIPWQPEGALLVIYADDVLLVLRGHFGHTLEKQ